MNFRNVEQRRLYKKLSLSSAGLLFSLIVTGVGATWFYWRKPEISSAMRGEKIARREGCFGCHGPGGIQGIADPAAPGGDVPQWSNGKAEMYIRRRSDIREWILYGAPLDELQEKKSKDQYLIPMPAYQDRLTAAEVDDLTAYFVAVSGWDPDMPDLAYEGRVVAQRMGCFGCHGPSGMGGFANPGSFKGYIPAWDGDEFAELVRDDAELREWVLDGHSSRLWQNPAARYFLERQKAPMPAYRGHLSEDQLLKLMTYIKWLREKNR